MKIKFIEKVKYYTNFIKHIYSIMEHLTPFLNKTIGPYELSQFTLYEMIMKVIDDSPFQNEVIEKLNEYVGNITNYLSGQQLKPSRFIPFLEKFKVYIMNKEKELKHKEIDSFQILQQMKKLLKVYLTPKLEKAISKLEKDNKNKHKKKIRKMIQKLKSNKSVKSNLIKLFKEYCRSNNRQVYLINLDIIDKYCVDFIHLGMDDNEMYISTDKDFPNDIFNSIIGKRDLEEYGDSGYMAMFFMALDWNVTESQVKSLKELAAIEMAKLVNHDHHIISDLPHDIVSEPYFRKLLDVDIQRELFDEYDNGQYIEKYISIKRNGNKEYQVKTRDYYVIFDNKYYIVKTVKFPSQKRVTYDKDLNIVSIDNDFDFDFDDFYRYYH